MELSTDAKIVYINRHISELSETDIEKTYRTINSIVNKNNNDIKKVSKTIVNNKTQSGKKSTTINISKTKKSIKDDISIDDDSNSEEDEYINENESLQEKKTRLILKYLNGLLKNIGKNKIQKLTEFTGIERNDILTEKNNMHLDSMEKELFPTFDRKACKYLPRTSKSRPLNVLKHMLNDVNTHTLNSISKEVYEGKYRRSATFYSIKEIV